MNDDDSWKRYLKEAAFILGFLLLDYLLYRLLCPHIIHVDPPGIPMHEHRQGGGGGNGNRAGQQTAEDGNGEGEAEGAEGEDDPPQEADLGVGEGGGDQREDDGGHRQQLPPLLPDSDLHHGNMLPGNDRNHDAPRTDKETTHAVGFFGYDAAEYGLSGKLNAKGLGVVLLKLLAGKEPSGQQGVSYEPLLR